MSFNEYEYNAFEKTAEIINNNIHGRKLILWGGSSALESRLKKEYGIKPYKYATAFRKKVNEKNSFINDFSGKRNEYYIAVPFLKSTIERKFMLYEYGYTEFEDYVFTLHEVVEIPVGTGDYKDEYGNEVHCKNCKVILGERTADIKIDIPDSCTFKENSEILIESQAWSILKIGEKCHFGKNCKIAFYGKGILNIGSRAIIGNNTNITVAEGNIITIGDDFLCSYNVDIYSGDGHAIFDLTTGERLNTPDIKNEKNRICIGDHVWAGMKSVVLNRAEIGDSCIIGAGAVVKGEFKNNCIIAGNPAKVIRENITWERDNLSMEVQYGFRKTDKNSTGN